MQLVTSALELMAKAASVCLQADLNVH